MAVKKWLGGTSGSTNDVAVASNYSPSGVPTTGDDLYVEANPGGTDYAMSVNLSTFTNVTLSSFNVSQTYTQQIGTTGTSNSYLQLGGTNTAAITVSIGYQYGGNTPASGSNLLKLDLGSSLGTITVYNSANSSAISGAGPIMLLGSHTSNALNIVSGTVSSCIDPSETARFRTVNSGGNLSFGSGVTLTNATINVTGGTTLIQSSPNTVNVNSGVLYTYGTGTIGTLSINKGSAILNSSGTITTLNVESGIANFSGDPRSKTVTNVTLYNGSTLNLNNGVKNSITITNPITTQANPGQYTLTPWANSSIALS